MSTATNTPASESERRRPSTARGAAEVLAVAVVANLLLALLLAALVDADSEFLPLQAGPVAVATAVGVLVGLGLLLLLRRLGRGRGRLFVPLIVVGTLLSLGGPLGLLGATPAEQPGVSDAAALALIPLHLLVGAVVAFVLPRRV